MLVLFWALLIASTWNKSITGDELVPPVAGYAYWKFGDFRLDPENGNLPQRLAALPLLGYPFAPKTSPAWLAPSQWALGDEWFHATVKDDIPRLLRLGRAASALLAVALAGLVWHCSRRLFGPIGAMLSLLLCVLNPTILANGSLMTSDVASALFFFAATWAWWQLIQEITPGRIAASALAASGLLLSKMSAGLLLPIAALLAIVRLAEGRPLAIGIWKYRRTLVRRSQLAAAIGIAGIFQALVAYATLWGFYNFRYDAFAPDQPSQNGSVPMWAGLLDKPSLPELVEGLDLKDDILARARAVTHMPTVPVYGWNLASDQALEELRQKVLSPAQVAALEARRAHPTPSGVARVILFCAKHRLFPEAYLIGNLHVWRFSQMRPAFLDGEHFLVGKKRFFPYTFAVKTPLPLFGLIVLAVAAAVIRRDPPSSTRPRWLYHSLPLWAVFIVYWAVAIALPLNIGHRHLLPIYPSLFVLCGAAGMWAQEWRPRRGASEVFWPSRAGWAVVVLIGIHLAETAWRFPHYLSYFNGIISPQRAYRHFIDSTLDWGQDLPGTKSYIDAHRAEGPFYLSYFGNGDPRTYGIDARFLPSNPGRFRANQTPLILEPLVSRSPPTADDIARLAKRHPAHEYIGIGAKDGQPHAVLLCRREAWQLTAGTYLISATTLQARYGEYEESVFQQLRLLTQPLLSPPAGLSAAEGIRQFTLAQWQDLLVAYEGIRQARLAAFLRAYTPDDAIGYSIQVFKVSDADIARALDGPAPTGKAYFERTLSGRPRASATSK